MYMQVSAQTVCRTLVLGVGLLLGTAYADDATPAPAPAMIRVQRDLTRTAPQAVTDISIWKVVAGNHPEGRNLVAFASSEGKFIVEVASYDKMELMLKDWPVDEFMYFLEGTVEITDSAGMTQRVTTGDTIVLPKGFNGRWKELTPIKKISVFYSESPLSELKK
jgi:hypothetical protein